MAQQIGNPVSVKSDNYDFGGFCYTKSKKVRGRLLWKIDDFTRRTEKLRSSVFSTPEPNKSEWSLELYPKGREEESENPHLSLFLNLESSKETEATAKLSLIDCKGRVVVSKDTGYYKHIPKNGYGFRKFVERAFVLNTDNDLLTNDELTIICEIEIPLPCENVVEELSPVTLNRPFGLAKDMGHLLSSQSLCDVTIRVGGEELRAHKPILCARSPVFAAMFSNEMAEKKPSVVQVTDVDADVFQEMLEHIYTDKEISQTQDRVKELLAAAEKYQLDGLKVMCEEALCKTLSVGNVLENLALAEMYNCSRLRQFGIRFVTNHRSDVIKSPDWETFKGCHTALVMEMFEKLSL